MSTEVLKHQIWAQALSNMLGEMERQGSNPAAREAVQQAFGVMIQAKYDLGAYDRS